MKNCFVEIFDFPSTSTFQNFLNDASIMLYEATGQRTSFDEITVHLPSTWPGCGQSNLSRIFPQDSSDVIIRNGSGSVLQPEGCGQTGRAVFLEKEVFSIGSDLALKDNCEFILPPKNPVRSLFFFLWCSLDPWAKLYLRWTSRVVSF